MIDPLTLLPLDTETILDSVRRTGRLVIVHEDSLTGGWGAEVAARAAEECFGDLDAPMRRIAALDVADSLRARARRRGAAERRRGSRPSCGR